VEKVDKPMKYIIRKLFYVLTTFFRPSYFGFIRGHSHLNNIQVKKIKSLVGSKNKNTILQFEKSFSNIVGDGKCIAYASGRMGFYDLLKLLRIGNGDEVIVLGSTCAVMVNSVLRAGAKVVYSDVDSETFGSSYLSIKSKTNDFTKLIVAQHSFGIPCEIEKIQVFAKSKKIFLLEDCALTLGSSVGSLTVGNFGDAALFSTDHSKPINTMIGGLLYTKNHDLYSDLISSRDLCSDIPIKKQNALWLRFLIEKKICNSKNNGKIMLIELIYFLGKKMGFLTDPFLSNDFNSSLFSDDYPFPAKLPTFIAQIGIYEIERWEIDARARKNLLKLLINLINKDEKNQFLLPKAYTDLSLKIIPLRFVWSSANGRIQREKFRNFIDVDQTWFMKPIIGTKEPLSSFGYKNKMCPISENIGLGMINIPCNFSSNSSEFELINKLKNALIID
jgi:perosamine synthetase